MDDTQSPHPSPLSRLTYTQKFIIISILFLISIAISGIFMVRAQNETIFFAELELKGNVYQRALRRLMETLPKHQWLASQYLSGDTNAKSNMLNLSSDIAASFRYLAQIDQELQEDLFTRPGDFQIKNLPNLTPGELAAKWDELVRNLPSMTSETSESVHSTLIEHLHKLIEHIGETGNLILDPTVEANYFMETILFQLPQAQILIPKMVVLSQKFFEEKTPEQKEREALVVLASFLQANLDTTKTTLQNGFTQTKNNAKNKQVEMRLNGPLSQYITSVEAFIAYTYQKLLGTQGTQGSESDYLILSGKALEDSFALWDNTIDEFDRILNQRIDGFKKQKYLSIAASALFALLAILFGILIMREISRPLTDLVKAAKRLADGDLSTRVPVVNKDEIGQVSEAFNQMAESFQQLIGRIQETGDNLSNSTREIAAAAEEQEAASLQQASTTKEIAVTAHEITSTSRELAKTMNDLSTAAEQTSSFASTGKAGLNRMELIMRQMVEASQNIATKLAVLSEKAGNITGVITTITKVAEQTNLLSLNAAIEAEKAGEHGRTFAVIAREIRRLADQTANATLDIEQTVNEIVSAVSAGVMSVDKFSEEIHTGVNQVNGVGEQLSKIIEQVQQQTGTLDSLNKAMQVQSLSAEQISEAITQLTEVSQNASNSIGQLHTSIEQLSNAAQQMREAIASIKS